MIASLRSRDPFSAGFDPDSLPREIILSRFQVRENLGPSDIEARYFQERNDGSMLRSMPISLGRWSSNPSKKLVSERHS